MKKRGYTMIEIIVCITLIALIGVGSIFGVRFVNNKIKINKLEQITNKAIEAAQVYLETNKEASKQLYSNSNGVSVPLQLLVNEGFLNIDNTDLTVDDLKDEYVVTFLGGSGGTENCEQITSSASWANDKPLYLCMKSDGSSNLATIDPKNYGNLNTSARETYWFKGTYPNNYAKIGSKLMRIISVDVDDTITVAAHIKAFPFSNNATDRIGSGLNSQQVFSMPYAMGTYGCTSCVYNSYKYTSKCDAAILQNESTSHVNFYGGHYIKPYMFYNTEICSTKSSYIYPFPDVDTDYYHNFIGVHSGYTWLNSDYRYLHLKDCMKITSGVGTYDNPFIIEDKGCTS